MPLDDLHEKLVHLYEIHAVMLHRYALLLCKGEESARDAVQEAFLRYLIAVSEGQDVRNPRAWLFRVVRNHLLDAIKSGRSKCEIAMTELPEASDRRDNPEQTLEGAELRQRLLGVLSPRELDCIRLRVEGLQYEEIADVLSIRCGTVGAVLARAQKKILLEMQRLERRRRPALHFVAEEPYAS